MDRSQVSSRDRRPAFSAPMRLITVALLGHRKRSRFPAVNVGGIWAYHIEVPCVAKAPEGGPGSSASAHSRLDVSHQVRGGSVQGVQLRGRPPRAAGAVLRQNRGIDYAGEFHANRTSLPRLLGSQVPHGTARAVTRWTRTMHTLCRLAPELQQCSGKPLLLSFVHDELCAQQLFARSVLHAEDVPGRLRAAARQPYPHTAP